MFEKYDAYKDSGIDWIGDIPADWDALKLKNVAFINPTNTALSNSLDKNTQVCFLAMENVEANGTVNYQNKRRLASVKSGFTNFTLYTTNFTEPLSYQGSAFLKLPKFP